MSNSHFPCCAALQNGRREHGNVGGAFQQHQTRRIRAQCQVLSIWMHRRLLHRALPITEADAVSVGQAAGWETTVLQHEIEMRELVAPDLFLVLLIIHVCSKVSWWSRARN